MSWRTWFTRDPKINVPTGGNQYTLAVGTVPDRTDHLLSLHVGPCWILINEQEFEALYRLGRIHFDRRNPPRQIIGMQDNGARRRRDDPEMRR